MIFVSIPEQSGAFGIVILNTTISCHFSPLKCKRVPQIDKPEINPMTDQRPVQGIIECCNCAQLYQIKLWPYASLTLSQIYVLRFSHFAALLAKNSFNDFPIE